MNWLSVALDGHDAGERAAFVRACAEAGPPDDGFPAVIADLLARHAPVAAVMEDFYDRFRNASRTASYPLEAIRRAA
ncbi:hypothetical protein [Nocardioides sp. NPDC127503]|uniref:hypothetical protein n=1 Tax=Nocardioides sp. NPDC127503 TaxID=3154516 RepID=UPI00331F8E25